MNRTAALASALYALAQKTFRAKWVRRGLFVLVHVAAVCVTYYVCFLIRFDARLPDAYHALFWRTLPVLLVISVLVFLLMNLYEGYRPTSISTTCCA